MLKVVGLFKAVDPFVASLLGVVALATLFPCYGIGAVLFDYATDAGIVLLFFLHGAKLSREAILGGMLNGRLHFATLAITFGLFPALGLLVIRLPGLDHGLSAGMLYLTLLPSTVQSSIAFTSLAGGNVSGAVCAATLSNLLGMFLTPILVGIFMHIPGTQTQVSLGAIKSIALQLLLPFVVGHLARPWLAGILNRHKSMIGRVDRSSILLVVYTAFSASIVDGLWARISIWSVLAISIISCTLLTLVLGVCWGLSRSLRLKREDAIVLLFCGSKKSLASGVPIAGTLFPAAQVGIIILPLMIFHQIQLIACAVIARRLGEKKTGQRQEVQQV